MSKKLIERLRELSKRRCIGTYDEAADRIEELEREVERKMSAADFILKERDALQADNARLREAMEEIRDDFDCDNDAHRYGTTCRCCLAEKTLASTPEQSLAEYRNEAIKAFVNEFSRHVGGDGEFWLHELQDFAMNELQ